MNAIKNQDADNLAHMKAVDRGQTAQTNNLRAELGLEPLPELCFYCNRVIAAAASVRVGSTYSAHRSCARAAEQGQAYSARG